MIPLLLGSEADFIVSAPVVSPPRTVAPEMPVGGAGTAEEAATLLDMMMMIACFSTER